MSGAMPPGSDGARHAASIAFDPGRASLAPLSFSQQQLWYICQYRGGTVAYNQPVAWRLNGIIDLPALERSFRAIIQRHESLRTTFPVVDGNAQQCIHADFHFSLRLLDLRGIPDADRTTRAQQFLLEEARHPFDLAQDLLLRAAVIQVEEREFLFIITVHHLVCDGWSMGVLIEELSLFYRAFTSDSKPMLRDLSIQYPEFAAAQREQMQGERRNQQVSYWKSKLEGLQVLQLPTDKPRPRARSFRGASQPLLFPKELTAAFKALTAREEVFFFMGLLAALQVLLYRYTGQTDIIVGAPVASRKSAKLQRSVGLFLNLIALRGDLSGDPTFRQLLKQTRDAVMGAYQHQDLPFEQVVEAIHPVRDSSRNPVFQIMLDQVDQRWIALDLDGVQANWFSVNNRTSKYDLTLAWSESPNGLRGWFEYNTDLFEPDTIERMLSHYQKILASAVANPDQRISEITMLTPSEQLEVLKDWNSTSADYPQACIHELFEVQARKTPDAVAVRTEESSSSYRELNRKANQLAHWLARNGVGRGSVVGVCLERSCDLLVALLGVLKTGAAYVPLDPSYPKSRLAFMVEDSGLKVLLTRERWADGLNGDGVLTLCPDRDWTSIASESEESLKAKTSPDDLAYVIYTSGSTGQPKGVLGLHRGAINRFAWMWREYPFEAGEVSCAKTSLSFVDSVWETFGSLLAGVPTFLISDETAKSPRDLIAVLARNQITRIVLVPSLLRALLDADEHLGEHLPQLKYWVSSGEALSTDLSNGFRASVPQGILLNLYGSSEVSADVSCYDTRQMRGGKPVLAGRPISNTQIYILDRDLQPVPVGVSGQLCVAGHGLAAGYLGRPEQTAEKFISNPFESGTRLYLTGDLARFRSDGNIELLGRIDHQVKIRGFRVELGEIETLLREHPAVKQALVTSRDDDQGAKRLVAYLVQQTDHAQTNWKRDPHAVPEGCAATSAEQSHESWASCTNDSLKSRALIATLRQFLKDCLPEYMLPSDFVVLQSLPMTPSGKVDRTALTALVKAPTDVADNLVEPRTPTEQVIRDVWREVLQIEQVSVHDNFFDLGGHSLLLASVHSRLMKIFDRQLPSTDLYQYPTISALAARLGNSNLDQRPLDAARERAAKQRDSRLRRTALLSQK